MSPDDQYIIDELALLERRYAMTTAKFLSLEAKKRVKVTAKDHAHWNALVRMRHASSR